MEKFDFDEKIKATEAEIARLEAVLKEQGLYREDPPPSRLDRLRAMTREQLIQEITNVS
jgi:hypothetical protein